ncbi:GNAT family N-acetyltransferase [Thioclava sp. BHET1]|nr:GNAT family N-acetyltransferase [Thioclava sp. BHET1]
MEQITEIDARGLLCPLPVLRLRKVLDGLAPGALVRLSATDGASWIDVPHFCAQTGHALLEAEDRDGLKLYLVRRGARSGELTLRPARTEDRDAIADLWHLSASLPGVGPPIMPSRAALRERLDQEWDEGWDVTVAETDSEAQAQIVAFLAIRPQIAILAELFVHPDWLGRGLGRRLMAQAKAAMPDGFRLYTSTTNTRAQQFYRAQGLVRLSEDRHPRTGHPMTWFGWSGD